MKTLDALQHRAAEITADLVALYLARNDPRIPWYAKVVTVLTIAYTLSPIDLIPDFIPCQGISTIWSLSRQG